MELSRSRPPIVIIIMSEFKVGGTYICTTTHYTHYKIFYSNTIFDRLTWGYNAANKKLKNKTKPKKSHNPKIKIELIIIITIGGLLRDSRL